MIVLLACAVAAFICTATDRRPMTVLAGGTAPAAGIRSGVVIGVIGAGLSAAGALLVPGAWGVMAVAALLVACGVWVWQRRRLGWAAGGALALLPFAGPLSALAAVSAVAGAEVVRMLGRQGLAVAILVVIAILDVCAFQLGLLERYAVAGVGADIHMHPLAAISVGSWQLGVGDIFCAAVGGAVAASWRGGVAFTVGLMACMAWAVLAGVTVPASAPALLAVLVHHVRLPRPADVLTPA